MPSASEILSGINKKAKTAADALLLPVFDEMSQKSRDPGVPLTDMQKSWDAWMKVRKEGGDETESRAAYDKLYNQGAERGRNSK